MTANRYRYLACATLLLACWPVRAQGPDKITPKIAGGGVDPSDPEADVVVRIVGPISATLNRVCTGTLITPMAVLTARHCINGDVNGKNGPDPPIQYPITIQLGNQNGSWVRQYTSNNITPSKTWANGPQDSNNPGDDVAVIFLDPPGTPPPALPGPALDYAQIVHPSLTSPCPTSGCGDADGGTYSPLGMAGWAAQDAPVFRQVAYDSEFNHYPGLPDDRGQYWEHIQGSIHDDPGDSGGPLFVRRPDPKRPGFSIAT